ncbi:MULTISPECIES: DUF5987 family protein [unclassified Streptomyces]|uniref:DUF5987 family protein n=2 Tax=Streptomyces TaxID=1883 RepID=UPI002B1D04B4|nr:MULTISPECIES: DUF5987 family protein [unclassified Streptomyces]
MLREPPARPTRRRLLVGLTAAVAALRAGELTADAAPSVLPVPEQVPVAGTGLRPASLSLPDPTTATLEAFADTMVPGEKRHSGDLAIAGAAPGPGAVQAGAIELLNLPDLGIGALLPELALLVNTRALAYAAIHGRVLLPTQPPFVALRFTDRTALAGELLTPGAPDRQLYVLLALFAAAAFDTAAHLHTTEAIRQRHPGLAWIGFPAPDADGLWRFPDYSYGRRLASEHPLTTPGGHPA